MSERSGYIAELADLAQSHKNVSIAHKSYINVINLLLCIDRKAA